MAQRQGVSRLNGGPKSFFFVFIYIDSENCSENHQSAWGSAKCKSSLGKNMISYRPYQNHLLYQLTFNNNSPPPHQFLRGKMLLKKSKLAKMCIEQII